MNNEPVAWMSQGGDVSRSADYFEEMGFKDLIPLYTHPVKELTDEEIKQLQRECITDAYAQAHFHGDKYINSQQAILNFARAILRKAKEKC
jgi:hypothetical protein